MFILIPFLFSIIYHFSSHFLFPFSLILICSRLSPPSLHRGLRRRPPSPTPLPLLLPATHGASRRIRRPPSSRHCFRHAWPPHFQLSHASTALASPAAARTRGPASPAAATSFRQPLLQAPATPPRASPSSRPVAPEIAGLQTWSCGAPRLAALRMEPEPVLEPYQRGP